MSATNGNLGATNGGLGATNGSFTATNGDFTATIGNFEIDKRSRKHYYKAKIVECGQICIYI